MQASDIKATALADVLGVDLKTIHNWANAGKLPSYRTIGRHLRFRRADVAAALRAMGNPVPEVLEPFARAPLPDRIERVYVAGPSAELDRCERVIARVREAGIKVTHDWTPAVRKWIAGGRPGYPEAKLLEHGAADLSGIASADVVLLLAPTHTEPRGSGYWTEQGAALALRKPVLLSERRDSDFTGERGSPVFAVFCHLAGTDKAALRMLRERAPGGAA